MSGKWARGVTFFSSSIPLFHLPTCLAMAKDCGEEQPAVAVFGGCVDYYQGVTVEEPASNQLVKGRW